MLDVDEISPGLALRLDPEALLGNGALVTAPPFARTRRVHYFICVEVRGRYSTWVATSSKPGPGRLPVTLKSGDRRWCDVSTYVLLGHLWTIDLVGLRSAAWADHSKRGGRNRASTNADHIDQRAA
jgi:hypothetical protein